PIQRWHGARVGGIEAGDLLRRGLVLLTALGAQTPGETLGDDAVDRRADEEWLDVHLDQTRDRRRRVVRVQRREHEVTGEGRLDRDLGRLLVADLTEQDHVRVGTQDRAQRRGAGEAGLDVHLHLVDAGDAVLDRVLDRDDVDLGTRDLVERRVQRGRLARARGAGDEDHAVRLREAALVVRVVVGTDAQVFEVHRGRRVV